jgi:ABC-type phosphate transport system substrate-binding protein
MMKMQSSNKQWLGTASVLALSATAFLSTAAVPANAQISQNDGIYAGGSTLASEAFRQIFDCYAHTTVGGDTFTFSSSFNAAGPTPGLLPTACPTNSVQGMYAGVGSGNGFRGYISNDPDQWYGGTVTPSASANISITTPVPAAQPPFVDSANSTNFGSYPFPRVDIGLSDSPLASALANVSTTQFSFDPTTGWSTPASTLPVTQITLNSTTTVAAYDTTDWGNPIQIPAFEVNVAVAVNVSDTTKFVINSQVTDGTNPVQGGAIQLTTAQLCAIFSGLVTDWSNTTTDIPTLDNLGNVSPVKFDYANVGNGHGTAQAYTNSTLPITVVYRSDGSGTSFILTNYLHAVCPLLAPVASDPTDQYKYRAIFGAVTPGTTFSTALISKITAARGSGPWNATTGTSWIGASGSGGVASTIGDQTGQAGYIGYVSADFTKPYSNNAHAPLEASLQNEDLRIHGVSVPSTTASSLTFIAPTPDSANNAWADSRIAQPDANSTYNDWNIYANTIPSTVQGGVALNGQSVLPLTSVTGAYPLSGTTFLALYSCYDNSTTAKANRVSDLLAFLNWFYKAADSGTDQTPQQVVANNGFHLLNPTLADAIVSAYLSGDPLNGTSIFGSGDGCGNGAK